MLVQLQQYFFYNASFLEQWLLSVSYFLLLYFGLGWVFKFLLNAFEARNWIYKIDRRPVTRQQIYYEIRHSLYSIFIFGFSAWPILYYVRSGAITLAATNGFNFILSIIGLNLYNEIHFFVIHRIMHLPFFMKHVHRIHHRSLVPTLTSVYSFHPLEALLLSAVPLCLSWMVPLEPLAIMVYPVSSIVLNFSGHCNYRFWKMPGPKFFRLGTRHNEHHTRGKSHFGFASSLLDNLYKRIL